jgi:SAM-dependent methyltransferase
MLTPRRRCPSCNATEPIKGTEATWPIGWRCLSCGRLIEQIGDIPLFAPQLADTTSGFDPSAFEFLARVEDANFWFVARKELIVGLVDRFFPKARSFLEIGCGNGNVLRAISQSRHWDRLVGAELHPSGLAHARKRLRKEIELVQMDARDIPASDAFDVVGAFDVIEHISEDEAVLQGLRRAVCTGGGILIAVPQHPWLWSSADDAAYHVRRDMLGELEAKLKRNGFEILFSSSFTALLLPFMLVSRLQGKDKQDASRLNREFDLDPRLNSFFLRVLRFEIRMTLAGWRWPAGGSRIVVGRAV